MENKPERKNTEARIQANNRYNQKAYDRINLAVKKGQKEIIQAHATAKGQSINAYIVEAVESRIQQESEISFPVNEGDIEV